MPAKSLRTMAKRAKKSLGKAEKYWKEAKKAAKKQGFKEGTDRFYKYVMGIVKRRLGGKYAATAATEAALNRVVNYLREHDFAITAAEAEFKIEPDGGGYCVYMRTEVSDWQKIGGTFPTEEKAKQAIELMQLGQMDLPADFMNTPVDMMQAAVEGSTIYELEVNDGEGDLLRLLQFYQMHGHNGHSFSFEIEGNRFGFDGDGSDKIYSIKVDGKEVKREKDMFETRSDDRNTKMTGVLARINAYRELVANS